MSSKFTELLDSRRLRTLWQPPGKSPADGAAPGSTDKRSADREPAAALPELGGPYLARESAQAVLAALQTSLRQHLGGAAPLLANLLHPLRAAVGKSEPQAQAGHPLLAAVGKSEPQAEAGHPLQHATTGNVFSLIDRIDDTATSLLARWKR